MLWIFITVTWQCAKHRSHTCSTAASASDHLLCTYTYVRVICLRWDTRQVRQQLNAQTSGQVVIWKWLGKFSHNTRAHLFSSAHLLGGAGPYCITLIWIASTTKTVWSLNCWSAPCRIRLSSTARRPCRTRCWRTASMRSAPRNRSAAKRCARS